MEKSELEKLPIGIEGFEDLSLGGLPKGRATLISGTEGSGKAVIDVLLILP